MPVQLRTLPPTLDPTVAQLLRDLVNAHNAAEARLQPPPAPPIVANSERIFPHIYTDTTLTGDGTPRQPLHVASGGGGSGITQLTGDVTAGPGSGSQAATLAASGVTPGTYGDATNVPQLTVDAKGRATLVANVPISSTGGTVTTTGSPASGNLTKFSGATSITNGDLSGDASTAGTLAVTLANSGASAGTYGSVSQVPVVTVDAKGRVTSISNVTITGGGGLSPENIFEYDDFVADSKFTLTVGTPASRIAAEANHPGIIQVSSTGGNTQNVAASASASFIPADTFQMVFVLRPNGHANAAYYAGAYGSISFTPNDAIFVRALAADTNWKLATRSGGSETLTDTGIAITNGTWYKITIYRKDASTIGCTVNAGSEVTATTNIPTNPLMVFTGLNVSSGTQTYDWDFWSLQDQISARY